MTGQTAADTAGPAVMLSYCVAGLGCVLAALCYAEFASMAPVAGSAYTYAYATLGELFAWIIGWDLMLEYAMSGGVVAGEWTKYLNELLLVLCSLGDPHAVHFRSLLERRSFVSEPAGRVHHDPGDDRAGDRHSRECRDEHAAGGHQGRRGAVRDRHRHVLRRSRRIGRAYRWSSESSPTPASSSAAGRNWPRWCLLKSATT